MARDGEVTEESYVDDGGQSWAGTAGAVSKAASRATGTARARRIGTDIYDAGRRIPF
jgi:hypothetical protein